MRASYVVTGVVCSLFCFIYFSGCQFSPQAPETAGHKNQAPTVILLQPEDGQVVGGKVTLVAKAEDSSGIETVSFYVDDKLATDGVVAEAPYEYAWDTTTLPNSSVHTISVQVMAVSGATSSTQPIYVTVNNDPEPPPGDTTPPWVKIMEPSDGAMVRGVVLIGADAFDDVAVKFVTFYIDGELANGGTDSSAPYEYVWNTDGLSAGSTHTIRAEATDTSSNTSRSQTVHVEVGGGSDEPQPLGVGGTWSMAFRDEFEGTSLDLTKWHPNWFGSDDTAISRPINDYEVNCYDPAQVTVSGGYLYLTVASTDRPECVKKDGTRADYASGLIMSNGRYNFTYGFIEARIFLPPGAGTPQNWAAFWTDGQDWPQDGEIDIMETLGGGSSTRWTYHYDADSGPSEDHRSFSPGGNMIGESGWHVFGAHWQRDQIAFYYDGIEVGRVTSGDLQGDASITSSPHYIILNLALNKKYPITVPSTMMVDYVRHWTPDAVVSFQN